MRKRHSLLLLCKTGRPGTQSSHFLRTSRRFFEERLGMVSQIVADRLRQSRLLHFPFHAGDRRSFGLYQVSLLFHPKIVTRIVRRICSQWLTIRFGKRCANQAFAAWNLLYRIDAYCPCQWMLCPPKKPSIWRRPRVDVRTLRSSSGVRMKTQPIRDKHETCWLEQGRGVRRCDARTTYSASCHEDRMTAVKPLRTSGPVASQHEFHESTPLRGCASLYWLCPVYPHLSPVAHRDTLELCSRSRPKLYWILRSLARGHSGS